MHIGPMHLVIARIVRRGEARRKRRDNSTRLYFYFVITLHYAARAGLIRISHRARFSIA